MVRTWRAYIYRGYSVGHDYSNLGVYYSVPDNIAIYGEWQEGGWEDSLVTPESEINLIFIHRGTLINNNNSYNSL